MRIPDPQLDYHADRFIAQRISAHGVTFEQYLTDPDRFDTLALEPEPLLPAQRAVAAAWSADTACPTCEPSLTGSMDILCAPPCSRGGHHPAQCAHCCDD